MEARGLCNYSKIVAICRNGNNEPQAIIQACSELIEVAGISDQNLNLFLIDRGHAYKHLGDYENALTDIDRALEIKPNHIYSWILRAYINTKRSSLDMAAQDFEKALALDPDRVSTLTSRAKMYYY